MFFSNAVIGLREGLEAALVVVILVAFLVRTGRRDALRWVWGGVGAAIGLSLLLAALLTYGTAELPDEAGELVAGIASIAAVVLVTAMIFWMRSAARTLSGELTGRLARAVDLGGWPVALVGFLGVGREGLESAIFFFATARAAGTGEVLPMLGWLVGLGAAGLLGLLIHRGAVRVDLRRFFRWTGVLLVVVAAGILAYGVHELQEVGLLPGEALLAFDLRQVVDPTSWYAAVIRGTLNLRPAMAVLEFGAWLAYVAVVLPLFLRPARPPRAVARQVRPAGAHH